MDESIYQEYKERIQNILEDNLLLLNEVIKLLKMEDKDNYLFISDLLAKKYNSLSKKLDETKIVSYVDEKVLYTEDYSIYLILPIAVFLFLSFIILLLRLIYDFNRKT